ncbi:hypothetical protein [Biformimicrobium ophioploci]|uniref:Uncharacterized protein n=1 Tax=Biformimicrobium ophioploci TaxID=3036711 RepID=A0ABQ6LXN7_9GAMM|nr:hypothetical protein [Microbulbifer sp. NKW57]GMG86845.1 hypothetical protein MNKW57_11660 [Microbulbifer sp. NKW57]
MTEFLFYSLVASVVLTVLINLLPMLFPRTARKAQEKMEESARRAIERREAGDEPKIKVFFPWKAMLIASIVLTVLVNLIGYLARG